jgi:hypothetical protein
VISLGCNCGKNRRQPTGSTAAAAPPTPPPAPPPPPPTGRTQRFTLTFTSGKTATYGSKLEADAARARSGGGSIQVQ